MHSKQRACILLYCYASTRPRTANIQHEHASPPPFPSHPLPFPPPFPSTSRPPFLLSRPPRVRPCRGSRQRARMKEEERRHRRRRAEIAGRLGQDGDATDAAAADPFGAADGGVHASRFSPLDPRTWSHPTCVARTPSDLLATHPRRVPSVHTFHTGRLDCLGACRRRDEPGCRGVRGGEGRTLLQLC